jgi:hypothetical protein
MSRTRFAVIALSLAAATPARANPPVASYIFPAGGQRGATVPVRVGGLFLHDECGFELLGPGVHAPDRLRRTKTVWFEGPILPLPASQQQEDYPKDMAGDIKIDAGAEPGVRHARLWTSQGATPSLRFVVGELPEVVEQEIDGDPVPVAVKLPVTINGRIFPRQDIDVWTFHAARGQLVRAEVNANRLGSPLDSRLEIVDRDGRRLAESDAAHGPDPVLTFTAPADGDYHVRIHDTRFGGGQAYVYRLTLTTGPHAESVYPLGGRRGTDVAVEVTGPGFAARRATVKLIGDVGTRPYSVSGVAGAVMLDADDLPELTEEQVPSDKPASFPAVLNGRIAKPGEIDAWTWSGRKGETWELELRAARLGSRLDGVLTVCDAGGKVLARAEASSPADPDAKLLFAVPADGKYTLKVQDRFHSRGGLAFAYRLRATPPPPPDFRLTLAADAVTLPRKGKAKLKLTAERLGGFKDAIALEVHGLPAGVSVAPARLGAGQNAVELEFKGDDGAPIRTAHVTVTGSAKVGAAVLKHAARPAASRGQPGPTDVLLAVALPTPFVIKGEYDMGFAPRGSVHRRKYKIERHGYDGPIEVGLTDKQARHLQGVTGPTITVPAGATEFTYTAYLPPWMETGRTCRVCVMGVATVKDKDGGTHRVSFSSVNQNEQLVAVVGPGQLALELDRTSFAARPGATLKIAARVKRGLGIDGPVAIELDVPDHLRGVRAEPCTIPAGGERGELVIRCADALPGPFNMPLTVRATLRRHGDPVTAEVPIDVRP